MIRTKSMFACVCVCVVFLLVFFSGGLIFPGAFFPHNNLLPEDDKCAKEAEISGWQHKDIISAKLIWG